jgi:hypothetical protein
MSDTCRDRPVNSESWHSSTAQNGSIWHMSEHEKYEQVGRLAEEVSHAKGKLAHVNEKLNRAQLSYAYAGHQQVFPLLKTNGGSLVVPNVQNFRPGTQPPNTLEGLLSHHELIQVLEEKERLTAELAGLTARLKELAPHLL